MKAYNLFCLFFVSIIAITQTSCDQIGAGPYPFAEQYVLRTNEETLLKAIEKFKNENPEYNLPPRFPHVDGKVNGDDYFHHLYFYYPDERKIVQCWIRENVSNKNQTIFALVAINTGSGFGNWKQINHDFEKEVNEREKRKFEKLILSKVFEQLSEVQ